MTTIKRSATALKCLDPPMLLFEETYTNPSTNNAPWNPSLYSAARPSKQHLSPLPSCSPPAPIILLLLLTLLLPQILTQSTAARDVYSGVAVTSLLLTTTTSDASVPLSRAQTKQLDNHLFFSYDRGTVFYESTPVPTPRTSPTPTMTKVLNPLINPIPWPRHNVCSSNFSTLNSNLSICFAHVQLHFYSLASFAAIGSPDFRLDKAQLFYPKQCVLSSNDSLGHHDVGALLLFPMPLSSSGPMTTYSEGAPPQVSLQEEAEVFEQDPEHWLREQGLNDSAIKIHFSHSPPFFYPWSNWLVKGKGSGKTVSDVTDLMKSWIHSASMGYGVSNLEKLAVPLLVYGMSPSCSKSTTLKFAYHKEGEETHHTSLDPIRC